MIGMIDGLLTNRNILTKVGQGAFFAHNADTQAIPTGATPTQLTIATEVLDLNSWLASSVFTPKQPGYYFLFGHIYITHDTDMTEDTHVFNLYLRKNGATPAYWTKTRKISIPLHVLAILEANGSSDYFDLAVSHNGGGDVTVDEAWFGGVWVSYNNP